MKLELPPRRLIPRWRPTVQTLQLAEAMPLSGKREIVAEQFLHNHWDLESSISAWRKNPTLGHLGDILGFSVYQDAQAKVSQIIAEAKEMGVDLTPSQNSIADSLDPGELPESLGIFMEPSRRRFSARVRELRSLFNVSPKNPLVLLDLAQFYTATGKLKRAERALKTANALMPGNRIAIRSLARFYVHIGKPDQAAYILRRAIQKANDPWLIASEIAVSEIAERRATSLSNGLKILKQGRFGAYSVTELAAAIAKEEARSGNLKRARALSSLSLQKPNDNVLAQAFSDPVGLGVSLGDFGVLEGQISLGETNTIRNWRNFDSEGVERNAMLWMGEEPFSSRPIKYLVGVQSVSGKYEDALVWVEEGLRMEPGDLDHLTNLAFVQASLGKLADAEQTIRRVRSHGDKEKEAIVLATEGLISMKRKNFDESDRLYDQARSHFRDMNLIELEALCAAYQARAAMENGHPKKNDWARLAEAAASNKKGATIEAAYLLGQIGLASDESEKRRLFQWVYDHDTNTLTKRTGLTKPGAPIIVNKALEQSGN